jgi:FixJ family two-component response regulator/HPt (histidine-containing phosphotransfer) domain-containing protein
MNLYDEFIIEAQQLLEEAEDSLQALYNNDDPTENWKHFLRIVHSIKGSAGFMEMPELESHCHKIENCCATIKSIEGLDNLESVLGYLFKFVDHALAIIKGKGAHLEFDYYYSVEDISIESKVIPFEKPKNIDLIVVDDDQIMLNLIDKYLQDTSYTYKLYDNPFAALDELDPANLPKIIISDIQMPQMDGREFLAKVRSDIADIPFVFVTALNDSKVFIDLVNAGAFSVMQKPLEKNHFIYNVNQAMKFAAQKLIAQKCLKHVMANFSDLSQYYESINKTHLTNEIKKEIEDIYELKKLAQ